MATLPLLQPTSAVIRTSTNAPWRDRLPELSSRALTLREVRASDAASLLTMVGSEEVSRYVSPPPSSIEGFERFIEWAAYERAAGGHVCYGLVPAGMSTAVGMFQVRALDPGFGVAEWGFLIGSPFWGAGLFGEASRLVMHFAFETLGAMRLEARAAVANGRGNGALRKLGAVQEGVLRRSFLRHGRYHDQLLWAILAEDWRLQRQESGPTVH